MANERALLRALNASDDDGTDGLDDLWHRYADVDSDEDKDSDLSGTETEPEAEGDTDSDWADDNFNMRRDGTDAAIERATIRVIDVKQNYYDHFQCQRPSLLEVTQNVPPF